MCFQRFTSIFPVKDRILHVLCMHPRLAPACQRLQALFDDSSSEHALYIAIRCLYLYLKSSLQLRTPTQTVIQILCQSRGRTLCKCIIYIVYVCTHSHLCLFCAFLPALSLHVASLSEKGALELASGKRYQPCVTSQPSSCGQQHCYICLFTATQYLLTTFPQSTWNWGISQACRNLQVISRSSATSWDHRLHLISA